MFGLWGIRVRVGVSVRVNYFRDSLSVLLRAQHYSMLTTFGSVSTAFFYIAQYPVRWTAQSALGRFHVKSITFGTF